MNAVHGNGEGFVRFLTDRTERHRARGKPLHDLSSRFDIIEGNRGGGRLEIEHTAEHQKIAVLLVDDLREFLESFKALLTHGMLQLADGRGIQKMALATHAILV